MQLFGICFCVVFLLCNVCVLIIYILKPIKCNPCMFLFQLLWACLGLRSVLNSCNFMKSIVLNRPLLGFIKFKKGKKIRKGLLNICFGNLDFVLCFIKFNEYNNCVLLSKFTFLFMISK